MYVSSYFRLASLKNLLVECSAMHALTTFPLGSPVLALPDWTPRKLVPILVVQYLPTCEEVASHYQHYSCEFVCAVTTLNLLSISELKFI